MITFLPTDWKLGRYGDPNLLYAVCSIILQRVFGMTSLAQADQKQAYAYALRKLEGVKSS